MTTRGASARVGVTCSSTSPSSWSSPKSGGSSPPSRWPKSSRPRCGGVIPTCSSWAPAQPWERIKRRERSGQVLSVWCPPCRRLLMAYRLQERAAAVGFDWPDASGPLAKVREELAEVEDQLTGRGWNEPADGTGSRTPGRAPTRPSWSMRSAICSSRPSTSPGRPESSQDRRWIELIGSSAGDSRRSSDSPRARDRCVSSAGLEVLDGLWNEVKERPERRRRPGALRGTAGGSDAGKRSPRECGGSRRSRRPCARYLGRSRNARRCRTCAGPEYQR